MEYQAIDIDPIIEKLRKAGLVENHETGFHGLFSIKRDGHILSADELEVWLSVLHKGSAHDDKTCSDLHKWNFEFMQ